MTQRTIAFFDFDNTLITGDSLWPFLTAVVGGPSTLLALSKSILRYTKRDTTQTDNRTFIKAMLLRETLRGKTVASLEPACRHLRRWMKETPTAQRLRQHYDRGHHVVIATGSLDIYMPSLLEDLPHHALLSTEMEIQDRRLTGEMASGNCVREEKATRVKAYLESNGPFDQSWAYGNYPHDLPMLMQVQRRLLV